jgi:hypothetical protein
LNRIRTSTLARTTLLLVAVAALTGFWLSTESADGPKNSSPQITEVTHAPPQPQSGEAVKVTAKISSPTSLKSAILQYQTVDPGKYIALQDANYKTKWISLAMRDDGTNGDAVAGDSIYTVTLPGTLQIHRRLIRYRIIVTENEGSTSTAPDAQDSEPNFAYYVYNGVPGWSGAIDPKSNDPKKRQATNFSPEIMRRIQAYHLISKSTSVENATWLEQPRDNEYKYTGTFVFEGKVYDHVRFRARGGDWRYAMGKNMWKIDFNKGHYFEARDDYGQKYRTRWSKLNLRSCIQQGDYGHRGEQGMFEAVGFRLFNLAGVEAPNTHWVQLRIVTDDAENPAHQYRGDFWGLYLAIENEDGRFLKEHDLPDGNLYKMKFGTGTLNNQGAGTVTNGSELGQFMRAYRMPNLPESWWRTNLDLSRYYSYRSVLEAIHHYDIEMGKNYDYFRNPKTGQWVVIPWDIDLTWADNMFGQGNEPFKRPVLSRPVFRLEYQNRLREIRDLLFNTDQAYRLIDECAAILSDRSGQPSIVDADRAKWDYHPIMISQHVLSEKAGQGLFYQASPTGDFAGMVQLMKNYVKKRAAFIDGVLLKDSSLPGTPTVTSISATGLPADRLAFQSSAFIGSGQFAAMKWRVGETTDANSPSFRPAERYKYEITPVWESAEISTFNSDITIPRDAVKAGHVYRVRVRMKDDGGRWSHWSEPFQFTAREASK